MKDKHPIINDEHVAVFNKKALEIIFKKNNYINITISNLKNFYSLNYWLKNDADAINFKKIYNFIFSKILKILYLDLNGKLIFNSKKN